MAIPRLDGKIIVGAKRREISFSARPPLSKESKTDSGVAWTHLGTSGIMYSTRRATEVATTAIAVEAVTRASFTIWIAVLVGHGHTGGCVKQEEGSGGGDHGNSDGGSHKKGLFGNLVGSLLTGAASRLERGTTTCRACRGTGTCNCPGCKASALHPISASWNHVQSDFLRWTRTHIFPRKAMQTSKCPLVETAVTAVLSRKTPSNVSARKSPWGC